MRVYTCEIILKTNKNICTTLSFQSVTLHTDLGELKIELFCEQVPIASEVGVLINVLFNSYS